jgi:FtsP/CotA-like multicopper oxidase with cupredoxin domain
MKKSLLIILLSCSVLLAFSQHKEKNAGRMDNPKQENEERQQPAIYTCEMHPEIQSRKPGKCPKCGMKLVKQQPKITEPDIKKEKVIPKDSAMHDHPTPLHVPIDSSNKNEALLTPIERTVPPRTVRYDLYIKDTLVNYTGRTKRAIAVNGQIPMPTLTFTEGDTAEIYVHNLMNEETSLHWHGIFLPNQYDGVPNLTQMPIKPHTTHVYRFPIIQHGTHWYHSHTKLQEQLGMYGSMILNKRTEPEIPTLSVILSEWTDMKPTEVHRSLHNATDWFAIKKGSTQSYGEAIRKGYFNTKITNEWKRMNAMDVSDVYYERFLINGKNVNEHQQFKAGDSLRLRIANGGASSYFWLNYAGGKITVVASDGIDVAPVKVDRLLIAASETYDVIVTIPDNKNYEFLVTPEDRTASASLWLGKGEKMYAAPLHKLNYFAGMKMMNSMMNMNGNLMTMGMKMSNQTMDMNSVMYPERMNEDTLDDAVTLNYGMLKATAVTTLPDGPTRNLNFTLTGNMNRYVWSMDNKVISEADKILIRKGERVKIILYNNTMMRHPMHLHGHDFRLLNGQGVHSPLKNIIDIMPMETDTIEFSATESGDWFFHCHILYHMMSGMGRVFSYANSAPNPEIPNQKLAQRKLFWDDRQPHLMAKMGIETNGADGEAMLAQTRWKLSTLWHIGYHDEHGYESETMLGRYIGKMQWFYPYVGFDYHYKKMGGMRNLLGSEEYNWIGQTSDKNNRKAAVLGIAYTLPMLIIADARMDSKGKFRFQLSREDISITPRLRFGWMINTDKEFMAAFRYVATKYVSLSTHYDSDMGAGIGLTIIY